MNNFSTSSKRRIVDILVFVPILSLAFASPAHAYIDPGSGSALMSIIIGAFVAVGLTIKTFWYRITSIFKKKTDTPETED